MTEMVPDFKAGQALGAGEKPGGASAPPKRSVGRPKGTAAKSPLKDRLEEAIGLLGVGVAVANEADGLVIIEEAESLASALDTLAKQNPKARKYIERALEGSAYGQLTLVCMRISFKIAANHGASLPAVALVGSGRGRTPERDTPEPGEIPEADAA